MLSVISEGCLQLTIPGLLSNIFYKQDGAIDSEALRRNRISDVVGYESDSEALRRNRFSGIVGFESDRFY